MQVRQPLARQAKQPFNYARVTIIEGEQGSGKSCTGVARVVDAYFKDCVEIYCLEKLNIVCEAKAYDRKNRVARIKYNGDIKLIRIPLSYKLHSLINIFANFHFFGIKYKYYPSFQKILEGLKNGEINEGKLVIDEAYIGINARESMSALGKELEKQSFQYRKMQLEVIIITPMARLIDWTARIIPTERISCSYNERTYEITLTIKKKGQRGTKEVTYDATQYFPNYWTNERVNA